MIIDCHGHYTTEPPQLTDYRKEQLEGVTSDPNFVPSEAAFKCTDEEMAERLEAAQLKLQAERGSDLTIFSPRAVGMGHHLGTHKTSEYWATICNNMVKRACDMYPDKFVPVCQLPQFPGVEPAKSVPELKRCINEMGFIGLNLNPDPSGAMWTDPPITDKWWYPVYEAMVELDVPAMLHVSGSCNPNFHHTGSHYLCGDTTVFMQLLMSDLFKDFPTLKFIIPHGGGAVPYHWGRFRGLAQDMGRPLLDEHLLNNVYFDTCVYHQAGIDCLLKVIPTKNILFASEMVGAVRGVDPETGFNFDDTKRYIDNADISDAEKAQIFSQNAFDVFPRLKDAIAA